MLGAIEAGGTKFICGVGDAGRAEQTLTIPTGLPGPTLAAVCDFFGRAGPIDALGVASFGPLDLDHTSPAHGAITATTKPHWSHFPLLATLRERLRVPVAIDTDVNGAAIAEARARGDDLLAYVTVGTGIGVGLAAFGRAFAHRHGEGGHLRLRRHPAHDGFPGDCAFHGDCLAGLASGPAIIAAWGASLADLPADHIAWEVEADQLGQLCATLALTLAPTRIVIGGGVMNQARLYPAIRARTEALLGGFIGWLPDATTIEALIAPPAVTHMPPGLAGAFLLAADALASA